MDDIQVYIDFDPQGDGGLLIALAFVRLDEHQWAGVCILNNRELETLFQLTLDSDGEPVALYSTGSLNPWDGFHFNHLNIQREFDHALPIDDALAERLESITSTFLQEWFFEDDGQHDDLVMQYEHLGLQVFPLNVRPMHLNEMDYCEDEEGTGVTWFEYRRMDDDLVARVLEEYL